MNLVDRETFPEYVNIIMNLRDCVDVCVKPNLYPEKSSLQSQREEGKPAGPNQI